MSDYKVEIEGLDELIKLFEKFGARSIPELKQAMGESVVIVEAAAKPRAPVNVGQLRNSITSEVRSAAGNQIEGVVGSNVVHAAPTEFGQRAHYPPWNPIEYWVRRKFGATGEDLFLLTRFVIKKIGRVGVKEKPFLVPAFTENTERILGRFQAALNRLIGK